MKVFLGIIAALALIVIGLGFIAPKDYHVERSALIEAPADLIFTHIKSFDKRQAWYPWSKKDPNMKTELVGTDGTVGVMHKWSGNEDVGSGEQTITELKKNESVKTHLKFIEPFASESDTFVHLKGEGTGTNVTWGFEGTNGFFSSIMMMVMGVDMDASVGPDYEEGLASLKKIAEADYATQLAAAAEAAAQEAAAADATETADQLN